jgi:negative regulator of flagellin synthesis FlgM
MKITGNVASVTGVYTNDKRISKVENTNKISMGQDDVKISSKGKDYAVAMNALKNVPDVRMDKVNDIAAKLESGEYKVSGDDIMNKLFAE